MPRLRVSLLSSVRARAGRQAIAVLTAGLALSFSFPEADLAPLAWVTLVPLLVALHGERAAKAGLLGYLFGAAFFGSLLIWISLVGWVAWFVLVALQASFIALFGALWGFVSSRSTRVVALLAAPVLWVGVDFLRANIPVGGFTWGQLAQSQHNLTWMLRPARFGGGWLVTFLLVFVNALIAWAWLQRGASRRALFTSLAAGAAVLVAPLGLPAPDMGGKPVDVAIVQGNVPRDFEEDFFDKNLVILDSHIGLTEKLAGDDPDVVIWPESSVGEDIDGAPEFRLGIERAARAVGAPLVVGGNLDVGNDRYKVMAFEISPDGRVTDRYQKTHLVPFGEYVPGRRLLEWIPMLDQVPRDAIPADEPVVFDVAGGAIAPVISFEGDFGSLVRERIDAGGRLLVVATNTSTWGESWASAQHVAFSQLRAAENGVWVAHAALSGISAFIAPDGRAVEKTPLWTATTRQRTLYFADGLSFYARTGDWLPVACLFLTLAVVGYAGIRQTSHRRTPAAAPTEAPPAG